MLNPCFHQLPIKKMPPRQVHSSTWQAGLKEAAPHLRSPSQVYPVDDPQAHYHTSSAVCIVSREKRAAARHFVWVSLDHSLKHWQTNSFPDGLRLSYGLTGRDCWKGSNYRTMLHSRNHCISFAGFTEFKLLSAALSLPLGLQNMPAYDEAFLDRNLCTLRGSLLPPNSSSKIVIIDFLVA